MPVTLTIKQVPDTLAEKLRTMASQNHRSLQGELMVMLEAMARLHDAGKRSQDFEIAVAKAVQDENVAASKQSLLAELDALVEGSTLGAVPWLTREEANERPMRINASRP